VRIAIDAEYWEGDKRRIIRFFGPVDISQLATIVRFGGTEDDSIPLGGFMPSNVGYTLKLVLVR
jgi:hypothetical protein